MFPNVPPVGHLRTFRSSASSHYCLMVLPLNAWGHYMCGTGFGTGLMVLTINVKKCSGRQPTSLPAN